MNREPVTSLKGIGEKTGGLFRRLGVETVEDLIHNYPRAYDAYEPALPIGQAKEGKVCTICGQLVKEAALRQFKNMQIVVTAVKDLTGSMQLAWYNMPYLRTTLQMGKILVFRGRVVRKGNRLAMEQPEVFTPESYGEISGSLRPVYGQTKGLGNKAIAKAVAQALKSREVETEYLPERLRKKYRLVEYPCAIEKIHFPANQEEMLGARKRLVFVEFLFFLLAVGLWKEKRQDWKSRYPMGPVRELECFQKNLPYDLTGAQKNVLAEVQEDLASGAVMNRLIQGDVGSGKTVIAVMALLQTAFHGYQGAMMAPTEVLAKQHFQSIQELFASQGIEKRVVLVTGSMTAREKRLVYEQIARHEADIIIGTHALIQEKVVYDKLALVITDEQHRFGVGQREALGQKGARPHVLVMSATPIPRTLAIILYGDLDISVVDQMPAGRTPIKNCVVDTGYRDRAYRFIEKEVAAGGQAYVICPMVEESEMMDAENVLDYTKQLRKKLPPGIRVEYLHGKMKGREKNQVMEQFASGEIQVLVSTTVVEVGVNVPNATVMMIENAERFGLAQLHQLRGRVGRGERQSYCIMVDSSGEEDTRKRLDILNRSNDGFYIASEDLKLRGPGDIFGQRQSGDLAFQLADIFTDADLLKAVSEEARRLREEDPLLEKEGHRALKQKLEEYLGLSYEKLSL